MKIKIKNYFKLVSMVMQCFDFFLLINKFFLT